MADFCKQCSIELFGQDGRDLANIAEGTTVGGFMPVLCEGCGPTLVNHDGECQCHEAAGGTAALCLVSIGDGPSEFQEATDGQAL